MYAITSSQGAEVKRYFQVRCPVYSFDESVFFPEEKKLTMITMDAIMHASLIIIFIIIVTSRGTEANKVCVIPSIEERSIFPIKIKSIADMLLFMI